jgi:hypothetical protein
MKQTKTSSILEQFLNVGSGIIISMGTWEFIIAPMWGFTTSFADNIQITVIYTTISMVRGYTWRRMFTHQKLSSITLGKLNAKN